MPRTPRPPAAKHWCFTLNNPTCSADSLLEACQAFGLTYAVFQEELSESGTRHFQGYLEFTGKQRLTALKKLLHMDRAHFSKRRGTRNEARDYAMKDDTRTDGPFEFGIWADTAQGKRSDLCCAIDTLKASGLRQVASDHPSTFVRFHRGLRSLYNMTTPVRPNPPMVALLYGPPGCGKTRHVRDTEDPEDLWISPPGQALQWFDGYEAHPAALVDDFDGRLSKATLSTTLQILDRYAIRVPIKGDFVPWSPDRVYITTNFHPEQWYDWQSRATQYRALSRRFTDVYYWSDLPAPAAPECLHLTNPHPATDPQWDAFWANII